MRTNHWVVSEIKSTLQSHTELIPPPFRLQLALSCLEVLGAYAAEGGEQGAFPPLKAPKLAPSPLLSSSPGAPVPSLPEPPGGREEERRADAGASPSCTLTWQRPLLRTLSPFWRLPRAHLHMPRTGSLAEPLGCSPPSWRVLPLEKLS